MPLAYQTRLCHEQAQHLSVNVVDGRIGIVAAGLKQQGRCKGVPCLCRVGMDL